MATEAKTKEVKSENCGENQKSSAPVSTRNTFANDGSFLEMFKKRMENSSDGKNGEKVNAQKIGPPPTDSPAEKKPTLPFVGKRRGGKVLKTGIVRKQKKIEPDIDKQDAWSRYMAEVNQYKQRSCTDDDKTRPLVK